MSDSVDARLVGQGFLVGVHELRSQGLVTNAVSRKYRQRNWSPATWSQEVSVNPAVSTRRLGARVLSVCVCVCVLLIDLFRSIYIFSNTIIITISCCFLVSWQKKSKNCKNLYLQQFTASLSTVSIKVEFKMRTGGDAWNLKSTKKCGTKNVKI